MRNVDVILTAASEIRAEWNQPRVLKDGGFRPGSIYVRAGNVSLFLDYSAAESLRKALDEAMPANLTLELEESIRRKVEERDRIRAMTATVEDEGDRARVARMLEVQLHAIGSAEERR